jgi:DNA polymerase I-like protein with 3'-5' exonuclease and polymerase domains
MLVGSDFSAQEPRLTAFMSQDPKMIQAYLDGKDLYAVIAQSMFNNEYWENLEFYPEGTEIELDGKKIICGKKTHLHKAGKERRSAAKTMLLAILYGMSPATAGARMGKSAEEGQQLMDNFFAQFPKVRELMDASMADLIKNGYVEDWAGRRRHLPDINLPNYEVRALRESKEANFNPFLECEDRGSSLDPEKSKKWWAEINKTIEKSQEAQKKRDPNFKGNEEMSNMKFESLAKEAIKDGVLLVANTGRKAQAQRQCLNARIQGGAASLTKLAMVNVDRDPELLDLDAHLVITVHDEVLVECPMAYAEKVEKRLPQVMIDTAKPFINVPMACDPYAERQWYIGEYSVSIQAEYKKLEQKGIDKETALAKVIANHPEMFPDAIRATIETGEEIDADAFADIIEDIEEFELVEPEVEETEEEEADSYVSLFN